MSCQSLNPRPGPQGGQTGWPLKAGRPGIVLITAVILIAAVMMIGTALMLAANMDIRHSGVDRNTHRSLFDADGMISFARAWVKSGAALALDNSGTIKVTVNNDNFDEDYINDPGKANLTFTTRDGVIIGWADVVEYNQTGPGSGSGGGPSHSAIEGPSSSSSQMNFKIYAIRALGVSPVGVPVVSRIVAFYEFAG